MSHSIDHVLLTRFNLPSTGAESLIRAKEGWLRNRLELFERYCLPSVLNQTNRNFHWIIYLDPQSPGWLKDRMREINVPKVFTTIYRAQVSDNQRLQDIKDVSGASRQILITTNLDNDDGLAADFVERLQALPVGSARVAVYFVNGLVRHGPSLYLNRDTSNAFCSVRESWDEPVTCWTDWHNRLGLSMPVLEIAGSPGWLQVVHGANVSNRIRGMRVAFNAYTPTFGGLLVGIDHLGRTTLLREAVLGRPYRLVKETVRALIKRAILRAVGKEGLDRIKAGRSALANIAPAADLRE